LLQNDSFFTFISFKNGKRSAVYIREFQRQISARSTPACAKTRGEKLEDKIDDDTWEELTNKLVNVGRIWNIMYIVRKLDSRKREGHRRSLEIALFDRSYYDFDFV